MQIELELLAPAKNKAIGIAAISCGADAVYIAADSFGAREAAGNSIEEIEELICFAHLFNAKVYITINTILYEEELPQVRSLIERLYSIGADALIVQDMAIAAMKDLPPIPLFASTQCNIRTPERARFLADAGFSRLILARELSIGQIAEIHSATQVPIEAFVHGALCVSYSGQCYLSSNLTGRSANRGCCAQACRWPYSLEDASGRVLLENQPLLSLKDLNMSGRIADLVQAGVTSFKIEGRLKNESYVRNAVSLYNRALENFIAHSPQYRRASLGRCAGGFNPQPEKTFNRGFTTLFADGQRGSWRSTSGAKGNGEEVGRVLEVKSAPDGRTLFTYELKQGVSPLVNGDGLCFYLEGRELSGARASLCEGRKVYTNERITLRKGAAIYRNLDMAFEREMQNNPPRREIPIKLDFLESGQEGSAGGSTEYGLDGSTECRYRIIAHWELGTMEYKIEAPAEPARNRESAERALREQLSKSSGIFTFTLESVRCREIPFFPMSLLNSFRRGIAAMAAERIEQQRILQKRAQAHEPAGAEARPCVVNHHLSYLANSSNSLSDEFYRSCGAESIEPAYELSKVPGAELMRTKYCLRYELGICPHGKKNPRGELAAEAEKIVYPLFLVNGGKRLELSFDCKMCEMTIKRITFAH